MVNGAKSSKKKHRKRQADKYGEFGGKKGDRLEQKKIISEEPKAESVDGGDPDKSDRYSVLSINANTMWKLKN